MQYGKQYLACLVKAQTSIHSPPHRVWVIPDLNGIVLPRDVLQAAPRITLEDLDQLTYEDITRFVGSFLLY